MKTFSINHGVFLELYQFFFLFIKTFIRWRNLSLEFSLKVVFRRWMFRGESKHSILNGSWWKLSLFIMVVFLELYLLFFLFFETLIRWRNLSLKFSLKVICRRLMWRGDSNHFISNGSWWKFSQFIMVFFLGLYQFFFLFFKTLIRWRNLCLGFSLKVICRRWIFRGESKHFILNGSWWKLSLFIMVFFFELYQFFFLFFKTFISWRNLSLEFALKVIRRRWIFRSDSKSFIFNGSWWNICGFIFLLVLLVIFYQ